MGDDLERERGLAHAGARGEDVEAAGPERHQLVIDVGDAGTHADLGVVAGTLDVVEGLVDHRTDRMHGGHAVEAAEVKDRLTAFVEQLGKGIRRAVGLVAQRLQPANQPTLEVVVPQQRHVPIEPGCRSEGRDQIGDAVEAADRCQGAVLVGLGLVLGHAAVEGAQPIAGQGV